MQRDASPRTTERTDMFVYTERPSVIISVSVDTLANIQYVEGRVAELWPARHDLCGQYNEENTARPVSNGVLSKLYAFG